MIKKLIAVLAVTTLVVAGGGQVASATDNHDRVKLKVEKEWVIASDPDGLFNENDVDVTFDVKVFRDWNFKFAKTVDEGKWFWLKKGSFVIAKENVTGLNENCTYEADGLKKWVKRGDSHQTMTVTNTVTCEPLPEEPEQPAEEPKEEEKKDEGVVLSASTTTPPASLPKTGSNSAALVAIVSAVAATVLVASTVVRRVYSKI